MSNSKVWYRWPENFYKGKDYVPWFIILRRLVFLPLFVIGISLTFLAILLSQGLSEAKRFWTDL